MLDSIARFVPSVTWLPGYKKENFTSDLSAGLTVAAMLIPQGMAYALLAGLPPYVGIYASFVPLIMYALLGTSRQLAVGPVAMVSLMTLFAIKPIVEAQGFVAGSPEYTQAVIGVAVVLALLVGVMQLAMGLLRLGFLVNFLSHPVVSGFTSAAALIIGFSQLKSLMGIDLPRSKYVHETIWGAIQQIEATHLATLIIGVAGIALLLTIRSFNKRFPAALVAVILGTIAVWLFNLAGDGGVAIVAEVPSGIPAPSLPVINWDMALALLPTALAISFVGFMESISVAKFYANRKRYHVDPNQELIGLGAANIAGSLFSAYPVTGGFSRTAVNAQAGARTPLASIITAVVIGLTLLFLTPLFYYLPKAILAAIIMVAVFGLIDVKEVRHLWHVKRSDAGLLLLTFLATLFIGIEEGIMTGVGASLILFIYRTSKPHTAILGRLPGTDVFRNVERYDDAQTTPGLIILRIDQQFYFGNVTFLKKRLERLEEDAASPVKGVIIDASGVNDLDSSAAAALRDIAIDYNERGIDLFFANVKGPVRDVMSRCGFKEFLGGSRFYDCLADAVHEWEEVTRTNASSRSAPIPADAAV